MCIRVSSNINKVIKLTESVVVTLSRASIVVPVHLC